MKSKKSIIYQNTLLAFMIAFICFTIYSTFIGDYSINISGFITGFYTLTVFVYVIYTCTFSMNRKNNLEPCTILYSNETKKILMKLNFITKFSILLVTEILCNSIYYIYASRYLMFLSLMISAVLIFINFITLKKDCEKYLNIQTDKFCKVK